METRCVCGAGWVEGRVQGTPLTVGALLGRSDTFLVVYWVGVCAEFSI